MKESEGLKELTDLEITKLCAEAMAFALSYPIPGIPHISHHSWFDRDTSENGVPLKVYDPLHDDAQAMALVKRFRLWIAPQPDDFWEVDGWRDGVYLGVSESKNLLRAVCICVAKMQLSRAGKNAKEEAAQAQG